MLRTQIYLLPNPELCPKSYYAQHMVPLPLTPPCSNRFRFHGPGKYLSEIYRKPSIQAYFIQAYLSRKESPCLSGAFFFFYHLENKLKNKYIFLRCPNSTGTLNITQSLLAPTRSLRFHSPIPIPTDSKHCLAPALHT